MQTVATPTPPSAPVPVGLPDEPPPMTGLHKGLNLTIMIVPFVAFILALVLLWNDFLWAGRTLRPDRRLRADLPRCHGRVPPAAHAPLFQDVPGGALHPGRSRLACDRGKRHRLGCLTTASTISSLTRKAIPIHRTSRGTQGLWGLCAHWRMRTSAGCSARLAAQSNAGMRPTWSADRGLRIITRLFPLLSQHRC